MPPTTSPLLEWTCSVCTFAGNPSLFLACTVCNSPRNYNAADAVTAATAVVSIHGPPQTEISVPDPVTSTSTLGEKEIPSSRLAPINSTITLSRTAAKPPGKEHVCESRKLGGCDARKSSTGVAVKPEPIISSSSSASAGVSAPGISEQSSKFRSKHLSRKRPLTTVSPVNNTRDKNPYASHPPLTISKIKVKVETERQRKNIKGQPGEYSNATNANLPARATRSGTDIANLTDPSSFETLKEDCEWRSPPQNVVAINNLSDRQYCCVWNVEVFQDGYRPEVARTLLAKVARHVNPILRARGWRVKRLIESCSREFLGCCYSNGRDDADAASTNIKLNLRVQPNKHCRQFYSFRQVLSVMLHEITHTSVGLEDIHPPAFWDLLREIRSEYYQKLNAGEVAQEADMYGCDESTVGKSGHVMPIKDAALDIVVLDDIPTTNLNASVSNDTDADVNRQSCGVSKRRNNRWRRRRNRYTRSSSSSKIITQRDGSNTKRRPLLKGAKMIDCRTKAGKTAKQQKECRTPRELAAQAATARLMGTSLSTTTGQRIETFDPVIESKLETDNNENRKYEDIDGFDSDGSTSSLEEDGEDLMIPHSEKCTCRTCEWEEKFSFVPPDILNS